MPSSIDLCSGWDQRHTQQDGGYHWVSSTYAKRISWMFIRLTNCPLCCSECNISPMPGVELLTFTTTQIHTWLNSGGRGHYWASGDCRCSQRPVNMKVYLLANHWSLFWYVHCYNFPTGKLVKSKIWGDWDVLYVSTHPWSLSVPYYSQRKYNSEYGLRDLHVPSTSSFFQIAHLSSTDSIIREFVFRASQCAWLVLMLRRWDCKSNLRRVCQINSYTLWKTCSEWTAGDRIG